MATTFASDNGSERSIEAAFRPDAIGARARAEAKWTLFGLFLLGAFLSYVALMPA